MMQLASPSTQLQARSADLFPGRVLPWSQRDAPGSVGASTSYNVRSWDSGNAARSASISHKARADSSDPDFEGACKHTLQDMELVEPGVAKDGTCVAYFDEITAYCCRAVGGALTSNTITPIGSSRRRSPSSSFKARQGTSNALTFPICSTTNYNDMLRCYDLIAGDHCKDHNIFPVGICNANSADTSGGNTAVAQDTSSGSGSGSGTSANATATTTAASRGQANSASGGARRQASWRGAGRWTAVHGGGKCAAAVWMIGSVLVAIVLSI